MAKQIFMGHQRKVPDFILDQVLGKEGRAKKNKDGSTSKAKPKQFKSMIKEGRKDSGQKNPRGGRNLSKDTRQQLAAKPGELREDTPNVEQGIIDAIMKAEKRKDFNREDVIKRVRDEQSGKKPVKKPKKVADDDDDDDGDHEYR